MKKLLLLEFYDRMKKKCLSFLFNSFNSDNKIIRYTSYLVLVLFAVLFILAMQIQFKKDHEDLINYIDFFKEMWK